MKSIIFDVDGTLWDSTDVVAKSWNMAVRENTDLEANYTGESLKYLFGKTMQEIFAAVFPEYSLEEQTRLGYICFDYENRLLETEYGTPYEGVIDTIKELSKKHDLYIVSNCQQGYIEVFLKTMGLQEYVKDHLCFGDTGVSKDQTILKLMKRNQLKDVVYVGDTLGDYNSCVKAGVPFIFAEYGFGEVPEAIHRINHFSELLEFPYDTI